MHAFTRTKPGGDIAFEGMPVYIENNKNEGDFVDAMSFIKQLGRID